jgi:uncharacterized protein YwqG
MSVFDRAKSESDRLSLPALHFVRGEGDPFSRIGGTPLVPPGFSWPVWKNEPLAFLVQLDLAEIAVEFVQPWMPTTGQLYFFYNKKQSTWGFDPADRGSWKVVYSNVPAPDLRAAEIPVGIGGKHLYNTVPLAGRKILSRPDWQRLQIDPRELTDEELEELTEIGLASFGNLPRHQLFGFPIPVQGDGMELECQLASNGIYCGKPEGYESPRATQLAHGAGDWRLLLQLDSDKEAGMMWGDAGTLYFWVPEADARKADFTNVWMILQCG